MCTAYGDRFQVGATAVEGTNHFYGHMSYRLKFGSSYTKTYIHQKSAFSSEAEEVFAINIALQQMP